jgi:hypothetical protein
MTKMSLDSASLPVRSHLRLMSAIPVIRRILLPFIFWPLAAQAQDQPIAVYFEQLKDGPYVPLNKAILAALSQPPFQLQAKPDPKAVMVSVAGKVQVEHKRVSGDFYSFTVSFSRDGSKLGESEQSCSAEKLTDCTDQLVLDVKTVAAPR